VRLPADSLIAPEKLTRYLLVPQVRSDKSGFLALAGYTRGCPDRLLADLRDLLHAGDAEFLEETLFGRLYEVAGQLRGPNGRVLRVRTIWMTDHLSGLTKFVTLMPVRYGYLRHED
jgi:hypothetical protein